MAKKPVVYIVLVLIVGLSAAWAGLNWQQVASLAIFSSLICGTLLFWSFRLAFAFFGLTALIAFGLIDIPHIIEFAGLDIILFLVAMMIVIGFLEERHFFDHLVSALLRLVGDRPYFLIILMMFQAAFFAALVDEVTSILFMTSTMLHITSRKGLPPAPFIMMLVFATNIGSSATVVGNPIGVIIALRGGLTFADFLRWAAPISLVSLVLTIIICLFCFRKDILGLAQKNITCIPDMDMHQSDTAKRKPSMLVPWVVFLGTIVGLLLHAKLEYLLQLDKNAMLLDVAFAAAGIVLLLERNRARELVERRVDWWTLAFFMMLFASVGTLKLVGTTEVAARGLLQLTQGNPVALFIGITWATGILTSIMDNVLAVATFIPIIGDLSAMNVNVAPLWWGMLFGGTVMGNMTIIGSTANIVAIGILERRGLGSIGMIEWLKPGFLVSIPTLLLATVLLWWQLF
jgi:Na+/H+ antiporter NhaD/arsenite permease-like protein